MPRKVGYGGASKGIRKAIKAAGGVGNLTSADLKRIQRNSEGRALTKAAKVAGRATTGSKPAKYYDKDSKSYRVGRFSKKTGKVTKTVKDPKTGERMRVGPKGRVTKLSRSGMKVKRLKRKPLIGR